MAYCRFSSDNWRSDVYVYKTDDGFVTHVAARRVVGMIPKIPELGSVDSKTWTRAYRRQHEYLSQATREIISLPHAGETFTDANAAECLSRLLRLRELGYYVPNKALEALRADGC